ncbi:putative salivary secreted peptide [Lycorma delicatula]|uniref:putative salivary secreted peptide n=1 Tax=Lycorma delicatula TaxID=130591 RepID=UPI003F50F2EF
MHINRTMISSTSLLLCLAVIVPLVMAESISNPNEINLRTKGASHNLILGQRTWGDRLLFHQVVDVHRKLFRKVTYDVKYPSGSYGNANISCITVIDLKSDGTGGYPYLKSGGVGYRSALINLLSQRSHGLHFNVTVYGK